MKQQVSVKPLQSKEWGPRFVTYWLSAIVALLLLFLGINTFIQPEAAIEGFGLSVSNPSDVPVAYIKADRDLFIGTILTVLLLLRMRRAYIVFMLFGTGMPLVDAWLVLSYGADQTASWIHLVTAAYMLIISYMMFREERRARTSGTGVQANVPA